MFLLISWGDGTDNIVDLSACHHPTAVSRSQHRSSWQCSFSPLPPAVSLTSACRFAGLPLTSRAGRSTAYPNTFRTTSDTATIHGSGIVTMPSSPAKQMQGATASATDMPIARSSELVANTCSSDSSNSVQQLGVGLMGLQLRCSDAMPGCLCLQS